MRPRRSPSPEPGSWSRTGATCSPRSATPALAPRAPPASRRSAPCGAAEQLPGRRRPAAGVGGAVNLASALTPNIAWRRHVLLQVEPVEAMPGLPRAGASGERRPDRAACYLAPPAPPRRSRPPSSSSSLLGALDLLKGPTSRRRALLGPRRAASGGAATAFYVRHEPSLRGAAAAGAALAARASRVIAALAVGLRRRRRAGTVGDRRTSARPARLARRRPAARDDLAWLPLGVALLGLARSSRSRTLLFRPLGGAAPAAGRDARGVRRRRSFASTGATRSRSSSSAATPTTSSTPTGRAFLGYRIENGVLLVSGDPVGRRDALPGLVREAVPLRRAPRPAARRPRGRRRAAAALREAGLRAALPRRRGDRRHAAFSLEGRAIRKVRQSVTRLEKAGYRPGCGAGALDDRRPRRARARLGALARRRPERGFSMAMDSLARAGRRSSSSPATGTGDPRLPAPRARVRPRGDVAVGDAARARHAERADGVPRRPRDRAAARTRRRGALAQLRRLRALPPRARAPRSSALLGRLVALANPCFQIESLYRFNAKFFPRWEPRYLLYEGALGCRAPGSRPSGSRASCPGRVGGCDASPRLPCASGRRRGRRG